MTPQCLMIERSVREGCLPSCCRELDSECRAFAYFRFLHVYPASVIFLHNPFGKCEPQSPASFFCGVSGIEYCLEILSGNPFAGISDFYPHDIFSVPVVMSSLPSPCMASTAFFVRFSITHSISGRDSCTPWSSTERCMRMSTLPDTRLFI